MVILILQQHQDIRHLQIALNVLFSTFLSSFTALVEKPATTLRVAFNGKFTSYQLQ